MQKQIETFDATGTATGSALPPGPGLLTRRQGLGAMLLCAGLSLGAMVGAGVWRHHAGRSSCASSCSRGERTVTRHVSFTDRQRLRARVAEAEAAVERGAGCRLGLIRLKLELNAVESELTDCAHWQKDLAQQRAQLVSERDRILAGIHSPE